MSDRQRSFVPEFTWEDIYDWAGSDVAARGEGYFKDKVVRDVQRADNGIIAKVSGREDYTTLIRFETEDLEDAVARCNCPYDWGICKHAVALLLTANALNKVGHEFPRFTGNADLEVSRRPDIGRRAIPKSQDRRKSFGRIREYLKQHKKSELISLLVDLAKGNETVFQMLFDQSSLKTGDIKTLVSSLRSELKSIMSEPAWWDGWKGQGHKADFSRVIEGLQNLYKSRRFEPIVEIADDLLEDGMEYIGMCHDEGDAAMEISYCLDIAFKAITSIDWPEERKLLWGADALLSDDYGICEGAIEILESVSDPDAWSHLADTLEEKLSELSKPSEGFHQLKKVANKKRNWRSVMLS